TTAPDPMTAPLPTVTPGRIVAPCPIQTSWPTTTRCWRRQAGEILLPVGIGPVVGGPVGEMMERRPPHRMVGRIDADGGGDIRELSDRRAPDRAVLHDIGIIADLGFADAAALGDLRIAAKRAAGDRGRRMNERRVGEPGHAAIFLGEK